MSQTQKIFAGLGIGIVIGGLINAYDPTQVKWVQPFATLFLRMIKMIIAPLIFATLVAGIAGAGHAKAVGRMGFRAIVYFEVATTFALIIGLMAVNLTKPGVGIVLPPPAGGAPSVAPAQTWDQIMLHLVPESVIDAM